MMLRVLYVILLIINTFLILIKSKAKWILPFNFLFCLAVFYITTNVDYSNYMLMYYKGELRNSYEPIFNILMDKCNELGITFPMFRALLWVIFGSVITWVYSKYSKNYPLFFASFYIYHLFITSVQIRFFCALALVTLGLYYLFQGKKLRALLIVILAMTFHISATFIIPFVLFVKHDTNLSYKLLKRTSIIIFFVCLIFAILGVQNSAIARVINFIFLAAGAGDKSGYLSSSTHFGFLLYFALHLGILFATFFMKNHMENKGLLVEKQKSIIKKSLLLQFYSIFSFPLIMININFHRFFTFSIIITFATWAYILDNYRKTKWYYRSSFIALGAVLLYRFPLVIGSQQIWDTFGTTFTDLL